MDKLEESKELDEQLGLKDMVAKDTAETQKNLGVTYDHVFSYFPEP